MRTLVNFLIVIAFAIGSANAQNIETPVLNYSNPTICGGQDGLVQLVKGGISMKIFSGINNVLLSENSTITTGLSAGNYKVEIIQCNGNIVQDSFILRDPGVPPVWLEANYDIQKDEDVVITVGSSSTAVSYSFFVNGEIVSESTSPTITLKNTKKGDVIMVQAKSPNGYFSVDSFTIQ